MMNIDEMFNSNPSTKFEDIVGVNGRCTDKPMNEWIMDNKCHILLMVSEV